jgi:hypothetical protein
LNRKVFGAEQLLTQLRRSSDERRSRKRAKAFAVPISIFSKAFQLLKNNAREGAGHSDW